MAKSEVKVQTRRHSYRRAKKRTEAAPKWAVHAIIHSENTDRCDPGPAAGLKVCPTVYTCQSGAILMSRRHWGNSTTVRSGAEERMFRGARVDVLIFRLRSYHVLISYSAEGSGTKFHKTLMFLGQAGTVLSFQARRSSAMRSSTSDLTVSCKVTWTICNVHNQPESLQRRPTAENLFVLHPVDIESLRMLLCRLWISNDLSKSICSGTSPFINFIESRALLSFEPSLIKSWLVLAFFSLFFLFVVLLWKDQLLAA